MNEEAGSHTSEPLYNAACRLVLEAGKPSISLLTRSFAIGYFRAEQIIRSMEGKVIAEGELDRYTAGLQLKAGTPFELQVLSAAA